MTKQFIYTISCEDAESTIIGPKRIRNLKAAIAKALKAMTYEELVEPKEDWFLVIVDNLCKQQGFKVLEPNGEYDVEEMYWDARRGREDEKDNEDEG